MDRERFQIKLDTFKEAYAFLRVVEKIEGEVTCISKSASSNDYRVNGKSILGIFSLDLSKPFIVEIPTKAVEYFVKEMKNTIEYLIKEL